MMGLYRALGFALEPVVDLWLKSRTRKGKEDPVRTGERRGLASLPRPEGPLMWCHGASVGELVTLFPLLERIRASYPILQIVVTSGTVTSANLAAQRLPKGCFHQYVPADLPRWVDRFLTHWQPDIALWVESELWPGLIAQTHARGIPMVLVNATLSARSASRWAKVPSFAANLVGAFDLVLARSPEVGERYQSLKAHAVHSLGDLKLAGTKLPVDQAALNALQASIGSRPVFLAASTHAGEEEAALLAHRTAAAVIPSLLTIIVPRHPNRADDIRRLLDESSLAYAQRSRGESPEPGTAIYLADTLGELGLFFSLADVTFIGGSLTPHGGHNPLEAAPFKTALLMGPDRTNNRGPADLLVGAEALLLVEDAPALAKAVVRLMQDEASRTAMTKRAHSLQAKGDVVLDSTLDAISPYIEKGIGKKEAAGPAW